MVHTNHLTFCHILGSSDIYCTVGTFVGSSDTLC